MAKRRRLTPAQPDYLSLTPQLETKAYLGAGLSVDPPQPLPAPPSPSLSPIARVAAETSAAAALQEVAGVLEAARSEGRLVQRLAIASIDEGYLVRDRLGTDEAEMTVLIESLRSHGQRQPIEVTELAPGRYGLISGHRRLTALNRLYRQTGEARYAAVLALLRRPETAGDAYVSMVEENEIRLGLSYYERARIAAKAVENAVFETDRIALQRLFASASRAKRSKIGTFLTIYRSLDAVLRFPAALPERLGLSLAKVLEADPAAASRLGAALLADPAPDAAGELARLTAFVAKPALNGRIEPVSVAPKLGPAPGPDAQAAEELRPGVFLAVGGGWSRPILTLSGPAVNPEFRERLLHWITHGV